MISRMTVLSGSILLSRRTSLSSRGVLRSRSSELWSASVTVTTISAHLRQREAVADELAPASISTSQNPKRCVSKSTLAISGPVSGAVWGSGGLSGRKNRFSLYCHKADRALRPPRRSRPWRRLLHAIPERPPAWRISFVVVPTRGGFSWEPAAKRLLPTSPLESV